LFYRINVIALHMPPLRERMADLPRIAEGYLRFCAAQCGKRIDSFAAEAELALQRYSWPGNLRELHNVVERAVILSNGRQIELTDLPDRFHRSSDNSQVSSLQLGGNVSLEELENEHIRRSSQSDSRAAAQTLGIDTTTLYRKRKN
jgi:NtrC-family two-component system response regulator AlgB